ncbi:MAG: VCBS repeat-containing protein [Deltaproteobacteria bacterium]|nr:MAG: VCBS repeat-containing protein [Deltaproteobacteria bacterium]
MTYRSEHPLPVARATVCVLLTATGLAACSGDDGRPGASASGSTTLTTGGETDGSGTGTGTGTAGETDSAGTDSATGGGCPPERDCGGGVCCPEGKLCSLGSCVADCGGEPACGPDEQCCQAGEICHAGACIVPGDDCDTASCATQKTTCPDDQVCDPSLGKCIPKVANESCTFTPPPQVFDPVPRFTWGERRMRSCTMDSDCQTAEVCMGGTCTVTWSHVDIAADDLPEYKQACSVPMVADLDADCVPEIVFNTYKNSDFTSDGVLRAIRGDTGEKVWTVTDAAYRTDATSNPAVGDITGDGLPDVVAQGQGKYLVAIDSTGTPLWQSDNFAGGENSGSVAIANLDGEGLPEIVFGAAVFDAAGNLLWEGTNGIGLGGQGPISCIADLTGDGRPELVGGKTAYTFTGTVSGGNFTGQVLWNTSFDDGYCGIADMDADGDPDVVLVSGGVVRILDGADGTQMANVSIPGGGHGGAPNIADFDGDGAPEVGTAGGSNYVVVDFVPPATATILWQAPTEDDSSSRTGSSVFDFDGDGRAEVVYNDEEYLRIYPGIEPDCQMNPPGPNCDGVMTDAEILFRDLNSSRTRTEYPVVADVDGDFKAELVFATNNEAGFLEPSLLGDAGIEVWEDKLDNWMPTRPVWNQHTYHVENVTDDGAIPDMESPSWTSHNSYRRNTQGTGENCAPDLVPFDLQADGAACPDLNLSVWVKNQGCLGVGPGVKVAFYEQTAGLLGVVSTQGPIVPGGAEKVALSVPAPGPGPFSVWVVVDDDGMMMGAFNECVEDNNTHDPYDACKPPG